MKTFCPQHLALIVAGAIAAALVAPPLQAQTAAEKEVLAPIQATFDGMAKRDAAMIKEQALPGGTLVLMRNGVPAQMTLEAFADRVARPGTTHNVESIKDPLIRIDNDLAVVWAYFEYTIDGKLDHCGTDLFTLVRKEGKWLIASISDTGRKDCTPK